MFVNGKNIRLFLLMARGEKINDIARELDMSKRMVWLRGEELIECGLLEKRKKGRVVEYVPTDEKGVRALEVLVNNSWLVLENLCKEKGV